MLLIHLPVDIQEPPSGRGLLRGRILSIDFFSLKKCLFFKNDLITNRPSDRTRCGAWQHPTEQCGRQGQRRSYSTWLHRHVAAAATNRILIACGEHMRQRARTLAARELCLSSPPPQTSGACSYSLRFKLKIILKILESQNFQVWLNLCNKIIIFTIAIKYN